MLVPLIKAARPHQWLKNVFFVGAPLIFARRLDDLNALVRTALAVAAFCCLASTVYLLNDIVDVEKDRAHPTKRRRPVASGALPVPVARVAAVASVLAGLGISFSLGVQPLLISAGYIALNLGYSFGLKRIAFVDVGIISIGFLLRVLQGATAIPVTPSGWLLICTTLLAAFLGFGKRAHELAISGSRGTATRDALGGYNATVLRWLMRVLSLATAAAYAAYTLSAHAVAFFGTRGLILTLPFVLFGLVRFLTIVARVSDAESPTDAMLKDRVLMANLALYAVAAVGIIYFRDGLGS